MAKSVNRNKGVDEPTPSLKEDKIEESVITTSEMIKSSDNLDSVDSDELLVIVNDPKFTKKPHIISRKVYEILRNREIEIKICK